MRRHEALNNNGPMGLSTVVVRVCFMDTLLSLVGSASVAID